MERVLEELRTLRMEVHELDDRLRALETRIYGMPAIVADHEQRIRANETFRAKALAAAAVGAMVGGGFFNLLLWVLQKFA